MAIELCSDNSTNNITGISPRISFSHDLCLSDIVPVEQHSHRSNSICSIDFDFCTRKSFDQDSSSADELFSNGKILPTEIKKKITTKQINDQSFRPQHSSSSEDDTSTSSTINNSWKKEKTKEIIKSASDRSHLHHNYQQEDQDQVVVEENKQNNSKSSFWRFKRSSSLKCVSGYGRSLCPLPLLSRSNSTGSAVPNNNNSVKRVPFTKDSSSNYNHKYHKQAFFKSQSSSSSSTTTITSHHQKPPLKKNYGSYGNASVRVNPVLNVPSGNLFGLSSIFSKEKIKKK